MKDCYHDGPNYDLRQIFNNICSWAVVREYMSFRVYVKMSELGYSVTNLIQIPYLGMVVINDEPTSSRNICYK